VQNAVVIANAAMGLQCTEKYPDMVLVTNWLWNALKAVLHIKA
jgi:hypothetical protein